MNTSQSTTDEPIAIGPPAGPFTPVPNRAEMRARRHSHKFEQPGRSRRQRVSNEQHRADVREHDRKWRQAKRRERRAAAEALTELPGAAAAAVEALGKMSHSAQEVAAKVAAIAGQR